MVTPRVAATALRCAFDVYAIFYMAMEYVITSNDIIGELVTLLTFTRMRHRLMALVRSMSATYGQCHEWCQYIRRQHGILLATDATANIVTLAVRCC